MFQALRVLLFDRQFVFVDQVSELYGCSSIAGCFEFVDMEPLAKLQHAVVVCVCRRPFDGARTPNHHDRDVRGMLAR